MTTDDRTPTVTEALKRLYGAAIGNSVYPSEGWYDGATADYKQLQQALENAGEGAEAREPDGWMTERDAAALRNNGGPTVHVWRTPSPVSPLPVYIGAAPEPVEQYGWRPIESAPKDGTYVLLAGPSGYTTTPLRVDVCRYDAEYRPLQPWVNHANNSFQDGGAGPTLWMPLPPAPEPVEREPVERSCRDCGSAMHLVGPNYWQCSNNPACPTFSQTNAARPEPEEGS